MDIDLGTDLEAIMEDNTRNIQKVIGITDLSVLLNIVSSMYGFIFYMYRLDIGSLPRVLGATTEGYQSEEKWCRVSDGILS